MCARYVDEGSQDFPIIREDFLGFIPIYDQSARSLTKVISDRCKALSLDMPKCVRQGYDGASVMGGHVSGVQSRIRQVSPKARYVHCASHRLNLALSKTMSIPAIRNCLGVIHEVANFFRNYPTANEALKGAIVAKIPDSEKKRLVSLCETRFIERHDSVISFVELFPCICLALEEVSGMTKQISSTASTLLAAVEKSQFLVSLLVCEKLFIFTLPLSMFLQEKSLDLAKALDHAKHAIETLDRLRKDSEERFQKTLVAAEKMSLHVFGNKLVVPRTSSKQTHRANPETSMEQYYRVTIFVPAIDSLIQNLTDRFTLNEDVLPYFQILLPGFADPDKADELENLSDYFDDKVSLAAIKSEYEQWCAKISTVDKNVNVLKLLEYCDSTYYQNIRSLLIILATLPVTTCAVGRSLSTMGRIKTLPRSVMGNE